MIAVNQGLTRVVLLKHQLLATALQLCFLDELLTVAVDVALVRLLDVVDVTSITPPYGAFTGISPIFSCVGFVRVVPPSLIKPQIPQRGYD